MNIFIKECNEKGLTEINKYLKMIQHQYQKVTFLLSKTVEITNNFINDTEIIKEGNKTTWNFEKKKLNNVTFQSSINFEMCLFYLYTSFDYFAHIINIIIFNSQIDTRKITFNFVINQIKKNQSSIYNRNWQDVIDSIDYKYLNAFVNTLKHRSILFSWQTLHDKEVTINSELSEIEEINYEKDQYSKITCPKKIIEFGANINNIHIPKMCFELFNYLKQKQKKLQTT